MTENKNGVGREAFRDAIKFQLSPKDLRRVMLAYKLSKYGHRGQTRDGGERYFEHPKEVALIIINELRILDPDVIISALLHDLQEDSFILDWEDLEDIFGSRVVLSVRALTKEEGKDYFSNLLAADADVLLVKLADRLHNLRTLRECSDAKKRKQIKETREKFSKIIQELKSRSYRAAWRASYMEKAIFDQCDEIEKTLGEQNTPA